MTKSFIFKQFHTRHIIALIVDDIFFAHFCTLFVRLGKTQRWHMLTQCLRLAHVGHHWIAKRCPRVAHIGHIWTHLDRLGQSWTGNRNNNIQNRTVIQLQADIERRKQQREQDQKTISALREENAQLRCNNEKNASFNENLRKENRDLKRKAYPERYVLPSFINVDATRIYKDKQGQCHIAMKFTGGSKEYSEKMSNEDFMAFKNGDLTKEEVIAKYHNPLIEGYIRREFSRPEKRSTALSLIENTIFGYMKLYANSTYVPSANGDNNPRKRRSYDDIDDMNDEERKGRSYR